LVVDKMPQKFRLREFIARYQTTYGRKGVNPERVNWPGHIARSLCELGCRQIRLPLENPKRTTVSLDAMFWRPKKDEPAPTSSHATKNEQAPLFDHAPAKGDGSTIEDEIRELEAMIAQRKEEHRIAQLIDRRDALRRELIQLALELGSMHAQHEEMKA